MSVEEDIRRLSDALIVEILKAFGLPDSAAWRRQFEAIFSKATGHFARIGLTFDRLIREYGFPHAAEWSLTNWCKDIIARGQENTPIEGPLLVVSNHPGAYDALVVSAQLPRPDLRIIASDLPFLRALPNTSKHIFFIPIDKQQISQRMGGMLSAVRYLKDGGAVLLMGSGTIDPDPAVYPGALTQLQRWTEAASLFLRFVPQTHILLSAVSHIVSPKWARHPLTWLQHGSMEKRRIAEFGQVLQQLFRPGSVYVSPRVSFAPVLTANDLGVSPREALVQHETALLIAHCQEFGGYLS
jgi:hypothetical protein